MVDAAFLGESWQIEGIQLMKRIIFLHNPKAGGSAVDRALRENFRPEEVVTLVSSPWQKETRLDRVRRANYVSGHFGFREARALDPEAEIITNFRNPIARLISLYDYWRIHFDDVYRERNPNSGPSLIHRMSFSDFAATDHPILSLYIDNFHSRQLIASGWSASRTSPLDRMVLRRRIARLKWFYVCEYPELSLVCLPAAIRRNQNRMALVNTTSYSNFKRTDPKIKDVKHILQRNQLDTWLYNRAIRLLFERARFVEA